MTKQKKYLFGHLCFITSDVRVCMDILDDNSDA